MFEMIGILSQTSFVRENVVSPQATTPLPPPGGTSAIIPGAIGGAVGFAAAVAICVIIGCVVVRCVNSESFLIGLQVRRKVSEDPNVLMNPKRNGEEK